MYVCNYARNYSFHVQSFKRDLIKMKYRNSNITVIRLEMPLKSAEEKTHK